MQCDTIVHCVLSMFHFLRSVDTPKKFSFSEKNRKNTLGEILRFSETDFVLVLFFRRSVLTSGPYNSSNNTATRSHT